MGNRTGLALAVAGGYLLGRTKKLKLALTVGGVVAGKQLANPRSLLSHGLEFVRSNPEFDRLRDQLMQSGRSAAGSAAGGVMGRAVESIGAKADALSGSGPEADSDGDGSPKKSTATKSTAKKSAAKRPTAERSTAKKSSAKSGSAGGSARKAPAKKSSAGARRGGRNG